MVAPTKSSGASASPASSYVFFDLDGTLVRTEMPHSTYFFVSSLPGTIQRIVRLLLFWPALILVGILNIFSVDIATRVLVFYALFGVTEKDARIAAKKAMGHLQRKLRPQLLEELATHKSKPGRKVYVLSGNIDVVIGPLVESLGCECVATKAHFRTLADGSRVYTGLVSGSPLLGEHKTVKIAELSHNAPRDVLYGYGNSRHDIEFLSMVGSPRPVGADSKLRKHALAHGWVTTFINLPKHALLSASDPWVESK